MLSFEEAFQLIRSSVKPYGTENVSIHNALNRILAQTVVSDINMPPFNKAAMDGFACRRSDLNDALEIIEEIPAGLAPFRKISENQCARIMTGGMVPEGADFILMKEHAELNVAGRIQQIIEHENANICYSGEDLKVGDIVFTRGTLLLPQHIAMLASVGCANPLVYKQPDVVIISTGNELVEPDKIPGISQIRNSNSYQLSAQVKQLGLYADYQGIVKDEEEALQRAFANVINKFQVIIISGGVSVGDYDFVPKILHELGVEILFHGMKAKPGKHLLMGKSGSCYVLGMPGNPVSSFVQFEVLVKPLLYQLMGNDSPIRYLYAPIETNYSRKKTGELLFIPVKFTENGTVQLLEYHGSAHIHAYSGAQGIMEIPEDVTKIAKGEKVRVRPI